VSRWVGLLSLALVVGCSDLDEGEGGVVALEVRAPFPLLIEVGETLQLGVAPLNAEGDSIGAPVSWRTPDATVTVGEASGQLTGVSPGTGRVQATSGSLSSELIAFTVLAPADTLLLASDSVVVAPVEPGTSAPLVVRLDSRSPPGPLSSRPVVYEITRPTGDPVSVVLSGNVLIDTLTTGQDGTASLTVSRVAGTPVPDSVFVEVRASRTRGAIVPGSGQRFIVLYQ
jgi:hypothetical protein